MKTTITAETIKSANQILLPNRYADPFTAAYKEITGREVPLPEGRCAFTERDNVIFRFVRGRDIPELVNALSGTNSERLTIGVTGSEWFDEYQFKNYGQPQKELQSSGLAARKFGQLALIAPPGLDLRDDLSANRKVGVVTPYPNLVNGLRIAENMNICAAVAVSGGAEGAAETLGMAAIDLVCKGDTIAANRFTFLRAIRDVYPVFLAAEAETQ